MDDAEQQLAGLYGKYEPAMAKLGKALRAKLRARLPGLFEIVYMYEKQHSLVISYSPTEKGYDGICSLSLYPDRAQLYFTRGALLAKADPSKLLQGRASVRYVVLDKAADLDRPEIEALIVAATKLAKVRLDPRAKGSVIVRAEAQEQRARRATNAARPAAKKRTAKAGR